MFLVEDELESLIAGKFAMRFERFPSVVVDIRVNIHADKM